MALFDSSIGTPHEPSVQESQRTLANAADLSRLSHAENVKVTTSPFTNDQLHQMEIGGLTIGTAGLAGGALGGGYGLAIEGAASVLKYPLALGMATIGGSRMAADLITMESRYMEMSAKYGVRGLAIGAGVGAVAFAAYEVKNYFDK